MVNGVDSFSTSPYTSGLTSTVTSGSDTGIFGAGSLSQLQDDYSELQDLYTKESKNNEEIADDIQEQMAKLEKDAKDAKEKIMAEAELQYDKDKDGDWETYLAKKLDSANNGASSSSDKVLSSLLSEQKASQQNLKDLQLDMADVSSKISSAKTMNDTLSDTDSTAKASGAGDSYAAGGTGSAVQGQASPKTKENLMSLISEDEYAIVKKNNLDLTEKQANGNPRYIFVKGQRDGKYHIYDLCYYKNSTGDFSDGQQGKSIAREYSQTGHGNRDVVQYGNGSLRFGDFGVKTGHDNGHGSFSSGKSEDIYWLDSDGTVKTTQEKYKTYTPLSFDMNGDGVKTSDKKISYDIDGDGTKDTINDSADAVLVFDKDGDGISGENGSECFGDNTDLNGDGVKDGYKDGFEALKALATQENLIGDDDTKLSSEDLKVLEDKYGLKIKTEGYNSQAKSLSDSGITEINLAQTDKTTLHDNFDGKGNQLTTQEGATFVVNGQEREYADIWHKKYNVA